MVVTLSLAPPCLVMVIDNQIVFVFTEKPVVCSIFGRGKVGRPAKRFWYQSASKGDAVLSPDDPNSCVLYAFSRDLRHRRLRKTYRNNLSFFSVFQKQEVVSFFVI